jgi:hypothetical protein
VEGDGIWAKTDVMVAADGPARETRLQPINTRIELSSAKNVRNKLHLTRVFFQEGKSECTPQFQDMQLAINSAYNKKLFPVERKTRSNPISTTAPNSCDG